jgi:hypothetical protein
VARHFQLQVTVGADGQTHDQLTLTYHDPVATTAADQAVTSTAHGEYRDYIQVLIPETAQLSNIAVSFNGGAVEQVSPEAVTYSLHLQDVAYWLIVPSGGSASVVLTYDGPFADISKTPLTYSLSWERQNGALTWPIDVSVTLPRIPPMRWSTDLSVDRGWSLIGGPA